MEEDGHLWQSDEILLGTFQNLSYALESILLKFNIKITSDEGNFLAFYFPF